MTTDILPEGYDHTPTGVVSGTNPDWYLQVPSDEPGLEEAREARMSADEVVALCMRVGKLAVSPREVSPEVLKDRWRDIVNALEARLSVEDAEPELSDARSDNVA